MMETLPVEMGVPTHARLRLGIFAQALVLHALFLGVATDSLTHAAEKRVTMEMVATTTGVTGSAVSNLAGTAETAPSRAVVLLTARALETACAPMESVSAMWGMLDPTACSHAQTQERAAVMGPAMRMRPTAIHCATATRIGTVPGASCRVRRLAHAPGMAFAIHIPPVVVSVIPDSTVRTVPLHAQRVHVKSVDCGTAVHRNLGHGGSPTLLRHPLYAVDAR